MRAVVFSDVHLVLDEIDADLSEQAWTMNEGYARAPGGGHYLHTYLHTIVLERKLGAPIPPGHETDHKNRNRFDNRRSNLRLATRSQNAANSARKGSARYRGVTWDKSRALWTAGVKVNYRRQNLGRFSNEEDAARAYDRAALSAFGEFALLNFPEEVRA